MLRARTERDRETETDGALLFVFMHPTQGGREVGWETDDDDDDDDDDFLDKRDATLRNKILRTKKNNKTRTPPMTKHKTKRRELFTRREERSRR